MNYLSFNYRLLINEDLYYYYVFMIFVISLNSIQVP